MSLENRNRDIHDLPGIKLPHLCMREKGLNQLRNFLVPPKFWNASTFLGEKIEDLDSMAVASIVGYRWLQQEIP